MLRKMLKRYCALLLSLVLVFSLFPVTTQAAKSGSLDDTAIGVSITTDGTAELNGRTINVFVTGTAASSSCTSSTPAASKEATLTITNNKSQPAILSFNYMLSLNGGTAQLNGDTITSDGQFSQEIEPNGSITVYIKSPAGAITSTVTLSGVSLIVDAQVTATFRVGTNGTYTLNGAAVTGDVTNTQSSTIPYAVSATPASGYKFYGWFDEVSGKYLSRNVAATNLMLESDCTIHPVFIPSNYGMFSVGGVLYYDLNEAVNNRGSNNLIILAEGGVLPAGNYTIPSGVTLLIPMDTSNTNLPISAYSGDGAGWVEGSYSTPTEFRRLTMESGATLNIAGTLNVAGKLSANGQANGTNGVPTGAHGTIEMPAGSAINVKNGGNLMAFGYITGPSSTTNATNCGTVTVESNGTVHEAFQLIDFRGGTQSGNMVGNKNKVFPFNQYYVQNIEVPLRINAGANDKVYSAVTVSVLGLTPMGAVSFIGSSGVFQINSGYITRTYYSAEDRMYYDIYGDVTISSLAVTLASKTVNSKDYVLPIDSNMSIRLHSGAAASVSQDLELLPGCQMVIDDGARLTVNAGYSGYIYDTSEWKNTYYFSTLYYPRYTAATRGTRTIADASIDVNGEIEINGNLYTTASGANIFSSGKTGKIVFKAAAPADTTTYQYENNSTYASISATSAQLHNGSQYAGTAQEYTQTAGAAANTTFYYCAEHDMWEPYPFTVSFNANGGTGTMADLTAATPTAASGLTLPANTFTYTGGTFVNWNTAADGSGTSYADGAAAPHQTLTLYAQWALETFTVTWQNYDGTTLATTPVTAGQTPAYTGATPTKPSDAQYDYTFTGWSPEIVSVTGDATYTAQFSQTLRQYTVTWQNYDGTTLSSETLAYGTTPAYSGTTPTRAADAQYTYEFTGWSPAIASVTGNATYTAQYSQTLRKFTITWVMADNSTVENFVDYGVTPAYSGETPVKASDDLFDYVFSGWTPEIAAVTGPASYTATFTAQPKLTFDALTDVAEATQVVLPTVDGVTYAGLSLTADGASAAPSQTLADRGVTCSLSGNTVTWTMESTAPEKFTTTATAYVVVSNSGSTYTLPVTLTPMPSIVYDEAIFTYSTDDWSEDTTSGPYQDSFGQSIKTTVNKDTGAPDVAPTASFTFTGTGYNIISRVSSTSGALTVTVKQNDTVVSQRMISTYFGFSYDATADKFNKNPGSEILYQSPVMREVDLPYGTYTVTVQAAYLSLFDAAGAGEYTIWLDGVQIYNPVASDDTAAQAIYLAQDEAGAQFVQIRPAIINMMKSGSTESQAVFLDGVEDITALDAAKQIEIMEKQSPANEVMLAQNQTVAFKIQLPSGKTWTDVASVQIGVRALKGASVLQYTYGGDTSGSQTMDVLSAMTRFIKLENLTGLYTASTDALSKTLTLVNTSSSNTLLSLTEVKITFKN